MEKYLGNKRVLLEDILNFSSENCPNAKSVFDIFSGTTNVARYFRKNGFSVVVNDINRFTCTLAQTYIVTQKYPQFKNLDLPNPNESDVSFLKEKFYQSAKKDNDTLFPLAEVNDIWDKFQPAVRVLSHLNKLTKKVSGQPYYILNHYTIFGNRSDFLSVRGSEGKRNYFSKDNAIKIDNCLEAIRAWKHEGLIDNDELAFLMTSIIEEIVLVANVNGTFHDFNRNKLWPNSLQEFSLKVPLTHASNKEHSILNLDASDAALKCPHSDILYIDPPYNFRQYSAYYHFLNFIAAYPFIDLKDYLKEIAFVRGQNPSDDFTSDFCFKDKFMDALSDVIEKSPCKYVIMSYYGGRNHWNHWSKTEKPTDMGFNILSEYFDNSKIFSSKKSTSLFKLRQNYQSRVGEKKTVIDEYLFFAERRNILRAQPRYKELNLEASL